MTPAPSVTPNDKPHWLLYGANGYTGELIAREAVKRGHKPILAGRSREAVGALARELNCECRVFSLDDQTSTVMALEDVAAVLNCAGPFAHTAGRMMQACLASHAHYLDITGEIDVFELAHKLDDKARRAHVVLCPGVGFDVVPTDCLAAALKSSLPDASQLSLGFATKSRSSVGTAKTSVEALRMGGRIRRDGALVAVPFGYRARRIEFGDGESEAVTIPWGDVSTAYFTTGIPNIEVYLAGPSDVAKTMRKLERWRWLLKRGWVQWLAKWQIGRGVRGPDQTERECNSTFVWGEAVSASGTKRVGRVRTANGYAVTVEASLRILEHVLANREAGYFTPSKLMGANFVESLQGSSTIRIE